MLPISPLIVGLPLVLSIVGFVLTTLVLFAGNQQGFMEEYAVLRLNTSMIGENILKGDGKSKINDIDGRGLLGDIKDKWHDITGDAKDKLTDIAGDIVGDIAQKLGVEEWYSLHIMNSCEGNFGANATATNFQLNVTNCTSPTPANRFNLTEILDKELSVGPLDINLASINWPNSIQSKIDDLNRALLALFIFYVLGVGFSGLSILCCIPAAVIPDKRMIALANTIVASLGAACITLGSAVVTAASIIVAKAVNKAGNRVGLVAERGTQLFTISWIAAGFMTGAALFWTVQYKLLTKKLKKETEDKETY